MAVYTQLSSGEIQQLADRLGIGDVACARGIAAGVENTTYFVTTSNAEAAPAATCEFVLTIAESIDLSDLRFIAELTNYLHEQHLPVPQPLADPTGNSVFLLHGKPALLVPRMPGSHPEHPSIAQCAAIGTTLARLHQATAATGLTHDSHRSLNWLFATAQTLLPHLSDDENCLLTTELNHLRAFISAHPQLPQALIHGDLFRDNTLFIKDNLTAIIDFFSAGTGYLLLDLAIVANDWCRRHGIVDPGAFNLPQLTALTDSYSAIRPLSVDEIALWPQCLRIAALRFWVSRLAEKHFQLGARAAGQGKDPAEYRQLLELHRDHPIGWPTRQI